MFGNEIKQYDIMPWEARTLICTSCLTIFPIYVALMRGLYFHAITSTGTGVISILYWQYPIHGWRRNMDLMYAKYSFLFYLISGIVYLPRGFPVLVVLSGGFSIAYTYRLTLIYPDIWIRYHVVFHILSILMKTYIISKTPYYYIQPPFID